MTDEEDKTAITMWSESLIEGLYIGIAKSGNDNALRGLITELKEKGYEENYLIEKVKTNIGPAEASRLQTLIKGSSAKPAVAKGKAKKEKKGLISKMFGK